MIFTFLFTVHKQLFVILSQYLWLTDIFCTLTSLNLEIRSLVDDCCEEILFDKLFTILHRLGRLPENFFENFHNTYSYQKAGEGTGRRNYKRLIQGITTWPTQIDFPSLQHRRGPLFIKEIFGVSENRCVAYQGPRLGGDRAFVANNHFPVFAISGHSKLCTSRGVLLKTNTTPFSKVLLRSKSQLDVVLSLVAYFEIHIHEAVLPNPNQLPTQFDGANCVAIGLALPFFKLNGLMPGWNRYSFGYHGDDGRFFHGCSDFGTAPTGSDFRFGPGDVVGFGLFYPPLGEHSLGGIFFTRNGELVGEQSFEYDDGTLTNAPWFPVVGSDTWSPIELNFGVTRPFQFNVENFEISKLLEKNPNISFSEFQLFGNGLPLPELQSLLLHPIVFNISDQHFGSVPTNDKVESHPQKALQSLFLNKVLVEEFLMGHPIPVWDSEEDSEGPDLTSDSEEDGESVEIEEDFTSSSEEEDDTTLSMEHFTPDSEDVFF